jgi:hypothetical protein
MGQKFRNLIAVSLVEVMSTLIKGAVEALRANRKNEGGSSKFFRSRKYVKKTNSRIKPYLILILVPIYQMIEVTTVKPSSTDFTYEAKKKKCRDIKSDQSHTKGCTFHNFLDCKPDVFKGDKSATDALRWIEEMETTIDVSGCRAEDKCDSPLNPLKAEPIFGGKLFLPPRAAKREGQEDWKERVVGTRLLVSIVTRLMPGNVNTSRAIIFGIRGMPLVIVGSFLFVIPVVLKFTFDQIVWPSTRQTPLMLPMTKEREHVPLRAMHECLL